MKVSFTGTGCSGKSTLLNLCKEYYGDEFKYVTEVTRPIARKGFTINEKGGDETQNQIIQAHIENNKLDDVIMDRCIVDGFIYTTWLYQKDIDEMMNILLKGKSFSDLYIGRVIYLEGDLEKRFNDIKIAIEQHEHTTTR